MKRLNIWFHIGFWLVYMSIFTIVEASYKEEYYEALIFELINLPIRLAIVYFNYFVLLPKLLLQGKFLKYFSYTLASLIIAGFIQRIINYKVMSYVDPDMVDLGIWMPYKFLQATVIIASPLIFITGISVIWEVAALQKRTEVLENEKLQSELKYLKSQINPHFLFNTLNHIYGLALGNSKKTPELILKLSDFLSFSLYESNEKEISLEKEIALMNDFVALEKSRFEDRVKVKVALTNEGIERVSIPPLILVPFVENAFKHSLKDETGIAQINIRLDIKVDKLLFEVKNSKPSQVQTSPNEKGIGLNNIKQRLDIIYGDAYTLDIEDHPHQFRVILKINLP